MIGLYENNFDPTEEVPVDPKVFDGMNGAALVSETNVPFKGTLQSPIRGLLELAENQVACVRYRDPKYEEGYIFPAVRLSNAVDPPRVLKPGDLNQEQSRNWRPMIGMAHSNKRASLDASGHRILTHEGYGRNARSGGQYSNMAPPSGNQYVERHDRSYQQHRSRPYDMNDRRGGGNSYNNRDRGGGSRGHYDRGGDRNNARPREFGYSTGGGGSSYGGNSYSRGGGNSYQGGRSNSNNYGGGGGGNNYSNYASQSYGYSTASGNSGNSGYSTSSSSGYNTNYNQQGQQQQGRYGSSSSYGGGPNSSGYNTGSTSQNRRGDRHDQHVEREPGRRQEGYYTPGYFTGSSSGNSSNSGRRYQ